MTARRLATCSLTIASLTLLFGCPSQPTAPSDAAGRYFDLERRLLLADHLLIDFHITSTGEVVTALDGQLRLATGNRLDLIATGTFGDQPVRLVMRSDGSRLTGTSGAKTIDEGTPKDLNKAVVLGLTRMGLLHNLAVLSDGRAPDRSDGGVTDWISVDSHRLASENTLTFDLNVEGTKSANASLMLRGDGLPAYREQVVRFPNGSMEVRERYPTIVIDGPIDGRRFAHP